MIPMRWRVNLVIVEGEKRKDLGRIEVEEWQDALGWERGRGTRGYSLYVNGKKARGFVAHSRYFPDEGPNGEVPITKATATVEVRHITLVFSDPEIVG